MRLRASPYRSLPLYWHSTGTLPATCGDTAAHQLDFPIYSDTYERRRNRIIDDYFLRKSDLLLPRFVVDGGTVYF